MAVKKKAKRKKITRPARWLTHGVVSVNGDGEPPYRPASNSPKMKPHAEMLAQEAAIVRAVELREIALMIVQDNGPWPEKSRFLRKAICGGFEITHASGIHSDLPVGLRILDKQHRVVLDVHWNARGAVSVRAFEPGEWESDLIGETLAKAA
jgi:hypothetical protein